MQNQEDEQARKETKTTADTPQPTDKKMPLNIKKLTATVLSLAANPNRVVARLPAVADGNIFVDCVELQAEYNNQFQKLEDETKAMMQQVETMGVGDEGADDANEIDKEENEGGEEECEEQDDIVQVSDVGP